MHPCSAGTEMGQQGPPRAEAEPRALHGRLRGDRKSLGPLHQPTPGLVGITALPLAAPSAAEALQELGSKEEKGAVADACPMPPRVPPARLPPGLALQAPQPRQQPPVKLGVVELHIHLAARRPHQPPPSTWGHLNSPARAAKGCFGWSWSREKQAPCILSKQLGKGTGAALGLERRRALLQKNHRVFLYSSRYLHGPPGGALQVIWKGESPT